MGSGTAFAPHVAVIGSGVAGASTAFSLASAGARVTVIDAGAPGAATMAGAGIIMPWATAAGGEFYRLYADGAEHYPRLLAQLAEHGVREVGYRVTGGLLMNDDAAVVDAAAARIRPRIAGSGVAGTLERVDGDRAVGLVPPLRPGLAGLYLSGAARVDGRLLRRGLLRATADLGATVRGAPARLVPGAGDTGRVRVESDGVSIEPDAVVVAAGAWTDAVLRPLGVRVGVTGQRGQILHLRADGLDTSRWPSVHPLSDVYLVAFDDSRVVFGATRESGSGIDARATAAGQRMLYNGVLSLAPGLADATVLETRVGIRPVSADPAAGAAGAGLPVVRRVDEHVWVNAGFGAAGLTMGPVVGHRLAAEVLGRLGWT
ncbi:NAD(P)/FAD-dependent oxidoreductase [Arthrobacter halodurans]|uniref:NAD(P)/FAD-dependent oxidoreductase n=1 Tax=Arthrobacter halodurans TaxID=516699 RepID=A0ABV4URC2_9MICC